MLQNIKELYGHKLAALDGDIGHVKDFYFDDQGWAIRFLVVDAGAWLPGRLVLLSPHAFGQWDHVEKTLHINLKKEQIQNSPSIESHRPVSRQFEIEYYHYFGLPAYWEGGGLWGLFGHPVLVVPPSKEEVIAHLKVQHDQDEKHLQNTQAITGFNIQALDETIGHVSGFMVDDTSWEIRELVVETGHWHLGKEILISPNKVEQISYKESKVFVTITKSDIQQTAENDVAKAGVEGPGVETATS